MVGSSPRALRHLKVCWVTDTPGNCGRCFKCLRAMTTLALGDRDDWAQAFEHPLTPEAILAHDLKLGQVWKVEDELLPVTRTELRDLTAAWEQRVREVRRHGPQRSLQFRIRRRARKSWRRDPQASGRFARQRRFRAMILSGLDISHRRREVVLQAQVEPERGRSTRVWVAVEESHSGPDRSERDPFVPTAPMLATAAGEDLRVQAPVSATLVSGAERASRLASSWWGFRPARSRPTGRPRNSRAETLSACSTPAASTALRR